MSVAITSPVRRTAQPFIGGKWVTGEESHALVDVFRRDHLADVEWTAIAQLDEALSHIERYPERPISPYQRYAVLSRSAALIEERQSSFVETLVAETGFLVTEAEREVDRTVQTLTLCAEEAKRIVGHMVPVHADPTAPNRLGFTVLKPLGVVCAITPFNSPLNMIAHKAGPAIAAGNAVVVKPAEVTPLSANLLVATLLDAGLPPESIALVHGGREVGRALLEHPVPAFYSFTGSTEAGRKVAAAAALRRSQLELGSISHTIVAEDADVTGAAEATVRGGFRKAGQVCTSVQKVLVQDVIEGEFLAELTHALAGKAAGDPRSVDSFIGPVISLSAANRIERWVRSAIGAGAELVIGGRRDDNLLAPTIVKGVPSSEPLSCREIFGPVVVVEPFQDFACALRTVNETPFGLAAGVFTSQIGRITQAIDHLQVGTVHINETSSARLDLMPFGGIKGSGRGTEGPAYAVREMSQERFVSIGSQ